MKKLLFSLFAVAALTGTAWAADKTGAAQLDLQPRQKAPAGFAPRMGSGILANPQMSLRPTALAPRLKAGEEAEPLMIYGSWTAHSESDVAGIYSFPATVNPVITEVKIDTNLNANCGGCYHDGKYYMVYRIPEFGMVFYYVWDMNTWTRTYMTWGETFTQDYDLTYSCIASDMAFDPVTEKIYGTFCDETGATVVFSAMDPDTGHSTPIKTEAVGLNAIVATPKGDLMGVGMDGVFYSIDKFTGNYTKIGDTGLKPYYLSSATYDAPSQKVYYICAPQSDVAKLYEIDPATGAATLVTPVPDDPQVQGIYTTSPTIVDNAPGQATAMSVKTTEASHDVVVSFKLPTKNYAGSADLEGNVDYILYLDGRNIATGSDLPGTAISVNASVPADGQYTFSVIASNSVGSGPTARRSLWVGNDAPREFTVEPKLTKTGANEIELTWSLSTYSGIHGGYINRDNITYEIIRYPDAKIVAKTLKATKFTETVAVPDGFQAYYYTVQAHHGSYANTPKASNTVNLGSAAYVPMVYTFDKGSNEWDLFSVVKDNDNYSTWKYDAGYYSGEEAMSIDSSTKGAKNDWLVTPPIKLLGLTDYTLSFDASNKFQINGKPENMEVRLCTGADLEALKEGRILVPEYEINTATVNIDPNYESKSATFSVENDGTYYIAFHATSPANMWKIFLDNIVLRSNLSPKAATDLTVEPEADASLQSTFTFTAPTEALNGTPLSKLTRVEVTLNGALVNALYNVAPGAVKEMPLTLEHGQNNLRVTAYNDEGAGLAASTTFFAGLDTPAAPAPVTATINTEATQALVSWVAPTLGEHGGFINTESLFYDIYNSSDLSTSLNQSQVWTETSCSITPRLTSRQAIGCYVIKARNSEGAGPGATSNLVFFGQAWPLTYRESFAGVSMQQGPWGYELLQAAGASRNPEWVIGKDGDLGSWGPKAQDGDNGFAYFDPNGCEGGARLYSPKIDLSKAAKPTLDFWYVGEGNGLAIEVSVDGCNTWKEVWRTDLTAVPQKEWQHAQVDLSDLKDANAHIAFSGLYIEKKYEEVAIDNIRLRDLCDVDLSPVHLAVPAKVKPDTDFAVSITVGNDGEKAAATYTVELYRNGAKVADKTVADELLPDATATVEFTDRVNVIDAPQVEYTATVVCDADGFAANNTSEAVTLKIEDPIYPAVTDLKGEFTDNHDVALTWTEPELDLKEPEQITEGFEGSDFTDFSNTGGNGWTVYDGDNYVTYTPKDNGQTFNAYDHMGAANAFLVFNPKAIALSTDAWQPHDGERMMTSFCTQYTYPTKTTDDWLISPEVHPVAQKVTFYARAYYRAENLEFYISDTDADVKSFKQLGASKSVGINGWTQFEFDLPEGTHYFAIRHYEPQDLLAVSIDDVQYIPAVALPADLSLMGYNIYRNGVKLNSEPVATPAYTDAAVPEGSYTYHVTAVYNYGESPLAGPVELAYSGLSGISANGIRVAGQVGAIAIDGADTMPVAITMTDGRTHYSGTATPAMRIPAAKGVYVVTVGGTTVKVAVK